MHNMLVNDTCGMYKSLIPLHHLYLRYSLVSALTTLVAISVTCVRNVHVSVYHMAWIIALMNKQKCCIQWMIKASQNESGQTFIKTHMQLGCER